MRGSLDSDRGGQPSTIKGQSAAGSCSGASNPETNESLSLVSPGTPRPCFGTQLEPLSFPRASRAGSQKATVERALEQGFLRPMPGPTDLRLALAAPNGQ